MKFAFSGVASHVVNHADICPCYLLRVNVITLDSACIEPKIGMILSGIFNQCGTTSYALILIDGSIYHYSPTYVSGTDDMIYVNIICEVN